MNNPIIRTARQVGADVLHGIESHGTLSFDNSTHILTVATNVVYWHNGTRVSTGGASTCDIDSYETLTANTSYFFYYDDTSGTLKCADSAWSINTTYVMVAMVYWNGSAGLIVDETHGYQRDLQWHLWAHSSVGARVSPADFAITAPSSGSPTTVDFAGGTLYDEDVATTHGQQTNCRVWYQVSGSKYTFEDSSSIYPSVGVAFSDSANSYTLTAVNAAQYINVWAYAAPDTSRGIWAFAETKDTSGYTTVAQARAVAPPSLAGFGLSPEMKLLYRIIMKGDETFAEYTDYRSSATIPGSGGSTSPTAASVTFAPSGNIAATNVQTAIEELDTEKSGTSHTHTVTDRVVAVFDGGGSAISADTKVYVMVPFAGTITKATALADQSGSIVVDVWKDTYANYPPLDADSITASAPVTISTATKSEDATLTGWTTSITAGDILCFNVDSCSTITWANVTLTVSRSV